MAAVILSLDRRGLPPPKSEDDTVTTATKTRAKAEALRAAWAWCKKRAATDPEFAARGFEDELKTVGFTPVHLTALAKRGFLIAVEWRRSNKYVFYSINPNHPPEDSLLG